MIRVEIQPFVIECESILDAHNLFACMTGAAAAPRAERPLVTRAPDPETIVVAELVAEGVPPDRARAVVAAIDGQRELAPLALYKRARRSLEEAPVAPRGPVALPSVPARQRTVKVTPGELTATRAPVRGADAEEEPSHGQRDELSARVVAAFARETTYPIPRLAGELFGDSTGRNVQKARLLIETLIGRGRLERVGVAEFRVVDRAPEQTDPDSYDDTDD